MALKDVGNKVPIYKLKTTNEVMKYYDEWGEQNKYNKDMVEWNYTGPKETVEVFKKYEQNKDALIFDAGCGTGLVGVELKKFGYKNFTSYLQYSYLSRQFSDSSNSVDSNLSGVIGEIPAYNILDISLNYKLGRFKFESGVNNLLNNYYFTRRATGYPGPGIIPSPPRNYYFTLQYKF